MLGLFAGKEALRNLYLLAFIPGAISVVILAVMVKEKAGATDQGGGLP